MARLAWSLPRQRAGGSFELADIADFSATIDTRDDDDSLIDCAQGHAE